VQLFVKFTGLSLETDKSSGAFPRHVDKKLIGIPYSSPRVQPLNDNSFENFGVTPECFSF